MSSKNILLICSFLFGVLVLNAQPKIELIKVAVTPNSADWNFKAGDKIQFDVLVTMNNQPLNDVNIRYELSHDMMPAFEKKELNLKNGRTTINVGNIKNAGFLRCNVYAKYNNKEYKGVATAGIDPEKIQPTINCPDDFMPFWNKAKTENAKIPMDSKITLIPERCTEKANVYHVNIQNYRLGSRLYGILCVPKAEGKYPVILKVPGAGVRPYNGDISKTKDGIITFEIGIHGIPVTMKQEIYDDLRQGALRDYYTSDWDDKDRIYYKRVYLGCVRAVDFIFSLKEFDGENIIVEGGSQGGALSVVTAALDNRIKGLICYYPALSDVTGYLYGRAGGWPHIFRNSNDKQCVLEEKVKTAGYYDVVNFARQLKVPGFYSFGYNDTTCAPTSVFSAINVITAPKEVFIIPETEHWTYPEQGEKAFGWVLKALKGN